MKLLLIEDDLNLSEHLQASLREQGFMVTHYSSKAEIDEGLATLTNVDFILLDRLIGAFDSKVYLPKMRQKWPHIPILVLSAISTTNERTELINLGADDYMGKPFSMQELVARVRALLRRTAAPAGNYLQVGNLVIDSMRRVISVGAATDTLPAKEFLLLRTLMQTPGKVWSKAELLDYVWGQNADVETNVVEATIANLRKRLAHLAANVAIRNMRNAGYWIEG